MSKDSSPTEIHWRDRCLDALDLMRDTPADGRKIAAEMRQQEQVRANPAAVIAADLIDAFANYFDGDMEAAAPVFERAATLFESVDEYEGMAFALFGTVAVWRRRGQIQEAYALCHARIVPALRMRVSRVSIVVYNTLGILSQELGYTEEAIRHFYTALNDARALQIPNRVAQVTANLGEIFYVSGNAEDAEILLQEARDIAINSTERWLAPFVSTMLALCKVSLDKYEDAYQTIATYIGDIKSGQNSDNASRTFCLSVAAYTLAMRGQLEEADKLSATAMSLLDSFEDKHLKPYSWWVSGHLHRCHKRYPEAIRDLRFAVSEIGGNGYIYMPLRAIKELSEIFTELEDWKEAYNEQKRYLDLFAKAQGLATRVHVQTLHIRNELKEAELARRMAERGMVERRQLEDELKRILAERETILENSIVGMVFLNNQGRVQWVNTPLCQIFGVERSQVLGSSLEPFYESREAYLESGAAVNQSVLRGEAYETELKMCRSDGDVFWVHFSGRAVDKNNLNHGTVWVVMDISARRKLEADLSKSEQHYRQLINNVTEGILVVQDGLIVFANPRVQSLTGYSAEELGQISFITAIYPEDRPMVIDHHTRRLRGEVVEQYYHFRVENHSTRALIWVELSAVMIDWEGRPATLSFVSDITQRKLLESQLKESMAEQIRLQTLQMQNELKEAEMARRHAEETTEAKSMFLANMSHEIRTPMNAIIGMAHLALRTDLNAKQKDYVEKIHKAGISLLGIINDILDFSKIEAGKLNIEQVDFNLDDVLNNISAVTTDKADEKGLEFLFRAPPDIPRYLNGDPLRLGQVLINLINNAIKFTEKGEIYVTCKMLEMLNGKVKLKFEVRDTGIGMSEEQSDKLFRPFSQADESTTRKFGGTGLGLSISKGMVELMGGEIALSSQAGTGTCVHFTGWFGIAQPVVQRQVVPGAINGMRLLIVDDNEAAAEILKEILSELPVEIDVVTSGAAALDAVRECNHTRPYGVLFTDLRMPEMDGLELITYLKRDGSLQPIPLTVLVSAHGREEVSYRDDIALPDGFLTKPVNASTLVDCMVELFSSTNYTIPSNHGALVPKYTDLRVLLVEDNEINQQIARELMEAAGIAVDIADNGKIAIDTLRRAGPDYYGVIFMDVQMPEMNGHEATRLIRADNSFDALPIVAMTAHAMVEERELCFASGMNAHLAKPINPKELYHAISHWCQDHVSGNNFDMVQLPAQDAGNTLLIDGIDVEEGLSRTLGNRSFYLELLSRFCDDQRNVIDHIRTALGEGDSLLAERLAHTLKGVAGLIGAKTIQPFAAELEQMLHDKADLSLLNPVLDEAAEKLYATIAAIDQVLALEKAHNKSEVKVPELVAVDHDTMQDLLVKCCNLLRDYDGEAVDLLLESGEIIANAFGVEVQKQIMRAVRQFDYDAALSLLSNNAKNLGYEIL
ncbi:response regulator [Undibacterium sp. TJN19]|uniref:response regulator n=1 Tax=Undibacterium sp. TJN19 TaxID=3413055 RepID=UPI003BF2997B